MNYLILPLFLLPCMQMPDVQQPNVTETEIKAIVERHNYWRAQVGVAPLEWSNELARVADAWARKLKLDGCAFRHSSTDYGENLFRGTTGYYSAADAVDDWADERHDYNYATNSCKPGEVCGHYTQIVWAKTTRVGCAKTTCNGMDTWVCNYDPPGNYIGQKPY
jgi:pathogenesis-related protein 1